VRASGSETTERKTTVRLQRLFMHRALHAFGDCSRCHHSIAYHLPLVGCVKCDCDEYQ
jgi:hypothetical protein